VDVTSIHATEGGLYLLESSPNDVDDLLPIAAFLLDDVVHRA